MNLRAHVSARNHTASVTADGQFGAEFTMKALTHLPNHHLSVPNGGPCLINGTDSCYQTDCPVYLLAAALARKFGPVSLFCHCEANRKSILISTEFGATRNEP